MSIDLEQLKNPKQYVMRTDLCTMESCGRDGNWLCNGAAADICEDFIPENTVHYPMRKLTALLVVTFLLYFAVAYVSSLLPNFDSDSYKIIGALTLKRQSIYPDPALSRHPYLPFFLYIEATTLALSTLMGLPQVLLIKVVLACFHLISVYALYLLSKKDFKTTFLYAINPISLLITAFHGQFDIVPIACILFAMIFMQDKRFKIAMLLLSLAITIKTWPILFIIPFLKRIHKRYFIYLILFPILSILIYSLVFHSNPLAIARVLIVYQGVKGVWGFGNILSFISSQKIFLLMYKSFFVGGILFYSYKQKRGRIVEEILELILFFFIFTPGFGMQWFMWLIPFLFLSKKPYVSLLYIPILIALTIAYLSWIKQWGISPQIASNTLMLVYPILILYLLMLRLLPKKNPL